MNLSPEDLAAFADGELDPARHAEVEKAVDADPALAAQVAAYQALKERLGAHFAPILQAPLPEALVTSLRPKPDGVASIAAARASRKEREHSRLPRWTWFAAPALAASLALAVFLPRGAGGDYAEKPLADALNNQLVAVQDRDSETRILLSFREEVGNYCRAFVASARSGVACRDDRGWRLVFEGPGEQPQASDYRMAGTPITVTLERAQALAAGPALDARQEEQAKENSWR